MSKKDLSYTRTGIDQATFLEPMGPKPCSIISNLSGLSPGLNLYLQKAFVDAIYTRWVFGSQNCPSPEGSRCKWIQSINQTVACKQMTDICNTRK